MTSHEPELLDDEIEGAVGGIAVANGGLVPVVANNVNHKKPLEATTSTAANTSVFAEGQPPPEAINKKALAVVNRVRDKLTGRDFDSAVTSEVPQQVDLLIQQATSHENLCQSYIGWCPFW